jgi:hypothetical protein
MGASCFTHRVRTTPVPKGFKLPHDPQKYDGSQEPQSCDTSKTYLLSRTLLLLFLL